MDTNIELRVINLYMNDKLSAAKISKLENIGKKRVYQIIRDHGLKVRTLSEALKTYSCNDSFFNTIDNEKKAYWLGVLYADGNISKKASNSGQIFFSSTDKEWVGQFLNDVNSTNNPRSETHRKYNKIIWKAQITSAKMYNDLEAHGCIPAKSLIIKFPVINDELIHHFIRGFFDGDGTVGVYKNISAHDWQILKSGLCSGSKDFLEELLKILPVKNKNISYKNVYVVQWSLQDSIKMYYYLYKDCTTFLLRKKQIFESYISTYKPRKMFNDYNRLP